MLIKRTLLIVKSNPVVIRGNKIMARNDTVQGLGIRAVKDSRSGKRPRAQLTPQRAKDLQRSQKRPQV